MQAGRQRVERVEVAVDADAHPQAVALRLDVDVAGARAHRLVDQVVDQLDHRVVADQASQPFRVDRLAVDLGLHQPLDQRLDARSALLHAAEGGGQRGRRRQHDLHGHAGHFLDLVDRQQVERVLQCHRQDAVVLADDDGAVAQRQVERQAVAELGVERALLEAVERQAEHLRPDAVAPLHRDHAAGDQLLDLGGLTGRTVLQRHFEEPAVLVEADSERSDQVGLLRHHAAGIDARGRAT
jgi:hypothetical protein